MHRETGKPARSVSRRSFIRQAAAGAGAVAAGSGVEGRQRPGQRITPETTRAAASTPSPSVIRVPEELIAGSKAPAVEIQFPMTGAQVFARACKEEGVAALFCCPGNYGVIHAIANIGIPTFSGRHEGAMTHAADAFIRVWGELAVAAGTEGPGFTDARTPLLVVASNMALFQEDTEAGIQLAYQQPTTDGIKKSQSRLELHRCSSSGGGCLPVRRDWTRRWVLYGRCRSGSAGRRPSVSPSGQPGDLHHR